MNRLSFRLGRVGTEVSLLACVDDHPLCDLVAAFEQASGYNDPAGGYGGLFVSRWRYQDRFRQAAVLTLSDRIFPGTGPETSAVLGCECGEWGCWPLMARIGLSGQMVRWDQFSQPHRPDRDYSAFGPFLFEVSPYVMALTEALELSLPKA